MVSPGALHLATILTEAAVLGHGDLHKRLDAHIRSKHKDEYTSLVDVAGDDESGTAVYSKGYGSKLKRAKYSVTKDKGIPKVEVDTENAEDVMPRTTYECAEAVKPKETATPNPGSLRLFESATALENIVIREARADYEIKLIAPGKGSSAFYPKEVLQRDGPKVFKAGTHVYVNHPTLAEEAARPEGDVKNLAGVLSTDAYWSESHAKGPGLYGRMKVFADHGQMVEEKAPHVGMSIRASGVAESDKKREGLPVLKELTSAESVDVVTKAGAGGMILTEAARTAANANEGDAMTEVEATQLRESNKKLTDTLAAQAAVQTRLLERAIKGDARELAAATLKDVSLVEAGKLRVIETVLRDLPMKDGDLDREKFVEAVKAEAKTEGAYVASLGGGARVIGMGAPAPVELTEAQRTEADARAKRDTERAVSIFESLGMPKDAAVHAAKGRAA